MMMAYDDNAAMVSINMALPEFDVTEIMLRNSGAFSAAPAMNATVNINLPVGDNLYLGIVIQCLNGAGAASTKAEIEAAITNIRLTHNSYTVIDCTPAEINMYRDYYGGSQNINSGAGFLYIPFVPSHMDNVVSASTLGVGTFDASTFNLQMTYGASITNVSSVTVFPHVVKKTAPLGVHNRIIGQSISLNGSTDQIVREQLKDDLATALCAVHFTNGSSTLTRMSFSFDDRQLVEEVTPLVNNVILRTRGRTPQTGWNHIDFSMFDELANCLPMQKFSGSSPVIVNDVTLKTSWSGVPGSIRLVKVQIKGLDFAPIAG